MSDLRKVKQGANLAKKTPILKSVDKSFEVLTCFTHSSTEYSINELAKKLHVSKGTIHRILITAQKRGFIEQNSETGKYQLGIKVFELGNVASKRINLREQSKTIMEELSNKTGETSYIVIRSEEEALGIAMVEGHNYLRMLFLEIGKKMPLYIGAGPKVLLAHMNNRDIDRIIGNKQLVKWTEKTVVEPDQIWKDIMDIRNQGYSVSLEDVTPGAVAVGAPIRNEQNTVIGAVSIAGPSFRFEGENLEIYISATKKAGMDISRRMGYVKQEL